ncbi:hypothetical protein RB195_006313 [Necator americanus]|uniref:Uncharacterized protein n=1 Tax=Necator americanus TaxID=51031 RepID=A0ABR1BVN3_NECAM
MPMTGGGVKRLIDWYYRNLILPTPRSSDGLRPINSSATDFGDQVSSSAAAGKAAQADDEESQTAGRLRSDEEHPLVRYPKTQSCLGRCLRL